jgi:hypothetical protein
MNEQTTNDTANTTSSAKKSGGGSKVLLFAGIGCVIIVIICICCSVAFAGLGGAGINAGINQLKNSLIEPVCENQSYSSLYRNQTTESLRNRLSEQEFENRMDEIQTTACDDIREANFFDIVSQGWTLNYQTSTTESDNELLFEATIDGKNISIVMVGDAQTGELLFDEVMVE